jgi:hypothetical protein
LHVIIKWLIAKYKISSNEYFSQLAPTLIRGIETIPNGFGNGTKTQKCEFSNALDLHSTYHLTPTLRSKRKQT